MCLGYNDTVPPSRPIGKGNMKETQWSLRDICWSQTCLDMCVYTKSLFGENKPCISLVVFWVLPVLDVSIQVTRSH